LVLYMSF